MRIKVVFHASKLPIVYRHRFLSLIKDCLKKADSDYKNRLYPEKDSEKTKISKSFCFAVLMPSARKIKKEKIVIDSNFEIEDSVFYFPENKYISLLVSSCDYEFIVNLYNGILQNQKFPLTDEIEISFRRAFIMNEKKIQSDNVTFKTLSPILIETKDDKPILPFNDIEIFNREFNAIHERILKDVRGYGLRSPLKFEQIDLKKQVVKHTLRGFREKTGKPYMTLTCFEGCFRLKGDPRDLQMLYQIGIGLRTGQGFGMVEVI